TWDTARYTNWQDELIGGTAHITNAQLTLSGGTANTQYRIGSGYRRETTVFPGDNTNQRASLIMAIDNYSLHEKFKTSLSINYSLVTANMLSVDLTSLALRLPPIAPALFDSMGNLNWNGWTGSLENPVAYTRRPFDAETRNLIANAVLSYAIRKGWDMKVNLGSTNTMYDVIHILPISAISPNAAQVNNSRFGRSEFNNWIVEPQINWKSSLGDGRLEVLIGTTFLEQRAEGLVQYASGFTSESLMKNIAAAAQVVSGVNYFTQYRYHAIFGRINYNYKSRYIVNLTSRRDGSSRFGPGKQFAFF